MQRRTVLVAMVATAAGLVGATPASAHWSPLNCGVNGLGLSLSKDKTIVRPGDTITYGLSVRNDDPGSCDITSASVSIALPGADGQPLRASPQVLTNNRDFLAPTGVTPIPAVPYVVNVSKGVTNVTPEGRAAGILHDSDNADGLADIRKTLNTQVTQPELKIDKSGSISSGQGPQNVTYTYLVTNTSSTPVPMNKVFVSDDLCAGPAYSSGDNGDGLLNNGETWTFTCSKLHQAPGVYTNTAHACAYSTVRGDDTRSVCSPPDTWTVTLTPPPVAAPLVAVKPVAVNQAACTLARTNSTTVRAGQLNTIKVRVRNVDTGTKVTLTLPGAKKMTATAGKNGLATFHVRPTKTGTAKIQAAACSDVESLSVKAARRVVAQRPPRVTG